VLPDDDEHWPASQFPPKRPVPSDPPHATPRTTATAAPNAALVLIRPADQSRRVPPTGHEILA
jgi:hypothetical protein